MTIVYNDYFVDDPLYANQNTTNEYNYIAVKNDRFDFPPFEYIVEFEDNLYNKIDFVVTCKITAENLTTIYGGNATLKLCVDIDTQNVFEDVQTVKLEVANLNFDSLGDVGSNEEVLRYPRIYLDLSTLDLTYSQDSTVILNPYLELTCSDDIDVKFSTQKISIFLYKFPIPPVDPESASYKYTKLS